MNPQDIEDLNQKLIQKYKKEFDAFLINPNNVEVNGPGGLGWRPCKEDGEDWTWDARSGDFMEFRIKTETTSTELFSTPKDFLKILKAPNHNFYYTQRKGIDSVSIVLVHEETLKIGLTRESKPPFSERENVPLAFKLTALGGSLFDMVDTQEYLKMSEEGRTNIAQLTAQKEVLEEAGYDVPMENVQVLKKVVFNSMSNEYVYLCVVMVDDSHKVPPSPQNHLESLASIEWHEIETLDIECGKTLATLCQMGLMGV